MSPGTSTLHIVMFPWFAMGHITPYLKLSNKLAEDGHTISFLIPKKTQTTFNHLNHHPHLIQFIPLTVPIVEGLPLDVETTSDSGNQTRLLLQALDLIQDQIEIALHKTLKNIDFIFYDHAYWIPKLAHPLGIKSIYFGTSSVLSCIGLVPRLLKQRQEWSGIDLIEPPEAYPGASSTKTLPCEMKGIMEAFTEFNGKISTIHRFVASMSGCDALCFNSCNEVEGPFVEYLEKQYNKKVLLIGPALAEPVNTPLEGKWEKWLSGFDKGAVVYCAFGSECVLEVDQFQELLLGLELTGLPFLARLKPPFGVETLEEALPVGFAERVEGRGVVYGGWVQQQQILRHSSVGCFVSHCGFGSMWESLVSSCQLVMVPHMGDQFVNSKFMSKGLKVSVEVERREEDGWFTKDSVCRAVKDVMQQGSEIGEEVRKYHLKWKEFFSPQGLESRFYNDFIADLQNLCS